MLIPRPVRAPVIAWLAAVGAGVVETLIHLAMPNPPTPADLAVRGAIYLAVVVLVLSLRTGRNAVRWALTLGLGLGGTASLLVEPMGWLADGGSPAAFLASIDIATAAVIVLRIAHLVAVGVAVVLMFRPSTSEFIRDRRARAVTRDDGKRHDDCSDSVRDRCELQEWTGHTDEGQQARKQALADLRLRGIAVIDD